MSEDDILNLTTQQLWNNFLLSKEEKDVILDSSKDYYEKTIICLSRSKNKYYRNLTNEGINPYHSNSYCVFLYWMSRFFSQQGYSNIADKIYYLNKMLN